MRQRLIRNMKRVLLVGLLIYLLRVGLYSQTQVFYVTPYGGGMGTSWNDPCSLEQILGINVNSLFYFTAPNILIYISKGDYYLNSTIGAQSLSSGATLNLNFLSSGGPAMSISIYGGFDGEYSHEYRDLTNNVTTFHSQYTPLHPYTYSPIYIQGDKCLTNMTIDGIKITSDGYSMSYPAIYLTWTGNIVLRNITIENYITYSPYLMFLEGQGCYGNCNSYTDITIENSIFNYNSSYYLCYSGSYLNMNYCYGIGNTLNANYIDASCGYYSNSSYITSTATMDKIKSHHLDYELDNTANDVSTNYRYYSLSGQFVGDSMDNLPQGLYIRKDVDNMEAGYKLIHKY